MVTLLGFEAKMSKTGVVVKEHIKHSFVTLTDVQTPGDTLQ